LKYSILKFEPQIHIERLVKMDPVTVLGLSLAGIVVGISVFYYFIKLYEKEKKRRQLLYIRSFQIL
jgi:hypothetical protein